MARSARGENARLRELRVQQLASERRRRLLIAGGAVGAVVVVVIALVVTSLLAPKQASVASTSLDPAVMTTLTGIPASTFDGVGVGVGAANPPKPISAPPLTADGKPRVLYVGAEYCPFCAGERWPFIVAMSRFGQFGNLAAATSGAAPEVFPNTATLSFHGSTYTSQYLAFTGVETQTNTNQPLDTLSAPDKALFTTYNPDGGIPWIDFGGKVAQSGASIDLALLSGKTQAQIARGIADPTTDISKAVLGSANVITARLCQLTTDQPSAVCSSAGVRAAAATLQ